MLHQPADVRTVPRLTTPEFSLVQGGLLFRLWRRAHLSGESLELVHRRVLVVITLTWLPLLLLSIADGAFTRGVKIPFFYDVEAHVRFLLALPLLLIAEVVIDLRVSPLVLRFARQRIIPADDLPAFNAAVTSALVMRDSVVVEAALLLAVYTVGPWLWRSAVALDGATWYARQNGTTFEFSRAGYWYAYVSIPLFQFILLRWYARLALWFRLLWRISRLHLHVVAVHPDGAGGLGFLGSSAYAFSPLLSAQGMLVAGVIATRILYEGKTLPAFQLEAVSWIVAAVLLILGPLVMFSPHLDRAWRQGDRDYGCLAGEYIFGFEDKWLRGRPQKIEALLGSGDIQALADLGSSHATVQSMRLVPFGKRDIIGLAVAAAAPLLPLALTMFSIADLLDRLFKLFFS